MNHCPSADQLEQLRDLLVRQLAEEHSGGIDVGASATQAHIQDCPLCQRRFDALAASDAAVQTPPTAAIETPPAFLQRLRQEDPERLRTLAERGDDEPSFPDSPTERGPLGRLGDYEIVRRLGAGGCGWVYLAHDRKLRRQVALKVLRRMSLA